MQHYDLSSEELALIQAFESGDFVSTKSSINDYKKYTKNHLQKARNVNIRLSESDVLSIKSKALEEGIPYQTLLASIIHKYATKNSCA